MHMKKGLTIMLLLIAVLGNTQNLEDAYDYHFNENLWPNAPHINAYTGEYQIYIDKLFWSKSEELYNNAISFSIEIVSFPFIPEDFDETLTKIGSLTNSDRVLTTKVVDGYYGEILTQNGTNGADHYEGLGWDYGLYKIFSKLDNINLCGGSQNSHCYGDYGLLTQIYAQGNYIGTTTDEQCHLPHTILKQTLYCHCGDKITDSVIDSISWIYDNTRGRMKFYPWIETEGSKEEATINTLIDVAFRPTFISNPDNTIIEYTLTSNKFIYNSGIGPNYTGSVNYFPSAEVEKWDVCADEPQSHPNDLPLLYYEPGQAGDYTFESDHLLGRYNSALVHPPPFTLLDAPLLNHQLKSYAGYYTGGDTIKGKELSFEIKEAFDLKIINPSEKIIYNPSEVTISCDLTFPCNYQFLTLRGKYADSLHEVFTGDYSAEYWEAITYFDFDYERDYPVPANCSTNSICKSDYIIKGGKTLTFQPPIIIMDAHFRGTNQVNKTTIHYNPNQTYGNWTYDPTTIELDSNLITLPVCRENDPNIEYSGNKSTLGTNSIPSEKKTHLKILNGSTSHPQIEVTIEQFLNTKLSIYNSFGSMVHSDRISNNPQIINCSHLSPGIYHTVLTQNGQAIDRISFGRK